jgi:hypothetical protein
MYRTVSEEKNAKKWIRGQSVPIALFFSLLCITITAIFHYTVEELEILQLIVVLFATFAAVFICVYFSLLFYRAKQEQIATEMIEKMRGVIKAAEGRVVIDNSLLKFVEEDASDIWVITKTLKNDVKDKDIKEAVLKNLKSGEKHYRYFIPDPDHNPTVSENLRTYKNMYKDHLDHVSFTPMPSNTFFMFDEIVIYKKDQENIFGYTYIDLEGSGKRDQVVRISTDNVQGIMESLEPLTCPTKETQERLIRRVMDLAGEVHLSIDHIKILVAAIISEELSVKERREFEDSLTGFDQKHLQKIQQLLNYIQNALQRT